MQSLWSDAEAERLVDRLRRARRRSRRRAARLHLAPARAAIRSSCLHGGGNTSVKTVVKDLLDEDAEVLCVKGSGWDMAAIEPAGLPAVRLAPLRKLRARATLSDEEMVRVQRANLIDPGAPNPSVETLLHAFLPHKFVDHTHSTAVLEPRRPAGRGRALRRSLRRALRARAVHHAGLSARQEGGRSLRDRSRGRGSGAAEARHLHVWRAPRARLMSA